MADPFLTLNGQPGEYLSRADDNLLDADTAHLFQSVGTWTNLRQGGLAVHASDHDPSPTFGQTFFGRVNTLAAAFDGPTTLVEGLTAGTTLAFAIDFWANVPDREVQMQLDFLDAGDVRTALIIIDSPLIDSTWVTMSRADMLLPANTVKCRITTRYRELGGGGIPGGEAIDFGAACLRQGSDATFVPSLRIVGDLDIRATLAVPDWTSPGSGVVAAKWDGATSLRQTYQLSFNDTGGTAELLWRDNALGFEAVPSSVLTGAAGAVQTLRATLEVSTGNVEFFLNDAAHGTGSVGATSLNQVEWPLEVGANSGGASPLSGDIYTAEVRDGIDGPVVYRMDAADVLAAI